MKTYFSVSESIPISKECSEEITVANNMIVGVNGLIATGFIIAENMIVTITQTLAPAEFYVDVTNDVLVTVS